MKLLSGGFGVTGNFTKQDSILKNEIKNDTNAIIFEHGGIIRHMKKKNYCYTCAIGFFDICHDLRFDTCKKVRRCLELVYIRKRKQRI